MNVALRPLTAISLFSGTGMLDEGARAALELAGRKLVPLLYVESGFQACQILASRFEEGSLESAPLWSDVRSADYSPLGTGVDAVIAGFPCQDVSQAGKRAGLGEGTRSGLWTEVVRCVREVRPWLVFLENVRGLLLPIRDTRGRVIGEPPIRTVLRDLADLDFDAESDVFSASEVGASHGRDRVFILAVRKGRGCGELRQPSGSYGLGSAEQILAYPGCSRSGRAAESTGEHRPWTPDDDCGTSRALGNSDGNGRQPWTSSTKTVGHGDSAELGHTNDAGLERRDECGGGRGNQRPAGSPINTMEPELANAERESSGTEQLENTGERQISRAANGSVSRNKGAGLLFAPGPDNPIWQDVLVRDYLLRPSLAQAEIEPHLHFLVNGMARLLDDGRTDSLRAAGNGVVPAQAAIAFIALAGRAGLISPL